MNNVAALSHPRLPALSQPLAAAVDAELRRPPAHPDVGPEPRRPLSATLIAEAQRMAIAAQAAMQPAGASQIAAWVAPLNSICRNPLSRDDLAGWANGMALACSSVPAQCFTVEALKDLMAKSAFFPSGADVLAIVQPEANRLAAKLRALNAVASAPVAGAERNTVSAEQKAAEDALNAERVAALKAEITAREHAGKVHKVTATSVNPLHLMIGYSRSVREGGPTASAAQARLDKLRADFPDAADELDRMREDA